MKIAYFGIIAALTVSVMADDSVETITSRSLRSMPQACTRDVKICPDGTEVGRNPYRRCRFKRCPKPKPQGCTKDLKRCPDGTTVGRDPEKKCRFKRCPKNNNNWNQWWYNADDVNDWFDNIWANYW